MIRNVFWTALLALGLLAGAAPAGAETVRFALNEYAPLDAEAAKGGNARIATFQEGPKVMLTRFVVDGESMTQWTEAFEVLNTLRRGQPRNARQWYEQFRTHGDTLCPGEWNVIAETRDSITFERSTPDCPPHAAQQALYRTLYGKREVFTLIATRKGAMTPEMRAGWQRVLDSAYLH